MAGSTATSPAATSPTETQDVKPQIIQRPSLVMKPAQTPPAGSPPPTPAGTMSLTSREWIIPPRPKPGRKPATDTPPSKRKAQNRAAQRAFRERRAARVNELEDQIKQIEDDHDRESDTLRAQVTHLEKEVEQYRTDLVAWAERCRRLENELAEARSSNRTPTQKADEAPREDDTSVGCGKCTLETRCQCIDEAFDAMGGVEPSGSSSGEKRAHSPPQGNPSKRIKTEPQDALEIDFTAVYSRPQVTHQTAEVSPVSATAMADPCGFCSDGTPCICAEMAAEQEAAAAQLSNRPHAAQGSGRRHPPSLSQFTPPPSEGDVSLSSASVPPPNNNNTTANPCANGPGTCAQCRADPNSTLFCKSLAASRAQSSQTPTGCCGGRSAAGGCCQSQPEVLTDAVPLPPRTRKTRAAAKAASSPATGTNITSSTTLPPPSTVTLTCADAYTTLSRHPAYERASAEITSWMPKLYASDSPVPSGPKGKALEAHRPAMEIDAANVMAVLKDFDRRFGRNSS